MNNVLIIVGSLRKQSINRSVAEALVGLAPAGVTFEIADISTIPLFNQDDEVAFPAVVTDLKNKIRAASGIIIVTPEYNRSIPGVLKNVIDWTSRPYGDSAWTKKAVGVMGASGGALGTALSQSHLRGVLSYLDTYTMGQPEVYLGGITQKLSPEGKLTDADTLTFLKGFVDKFVSHIHIVNQK